MNELVQQHLEAIRALSREYGIVRLEVFGSVCTPEFDPETSDIDFIVEYPLDYELGLWMTRYFEFKQRLEALLGRPVDLVMASAMRKLHFIESVNETRQLLYAA
jgi:predicted nucleotidyltransferase